jgi:hypothetical protein
MRRRDFEKHSTKQNKAEEGPSQPTLITVLFTAADGCYDEDGNFLI